MTQVVPVQGHEVVRNGKGGRVNREKLRAISPLAPPLDAGGALQANDSG
jgi:hypothetical protein